MKPILCHECKHNIDDHNTTGCVNKLDDRFTCACENLPSNIAAHAVQAAVNEAVEVIKPFADIYDNEVMEYGEVVSVTDFDDYPELEYWESAAAWLAAHTEPQDVRTDAERNFDQWQAETYQTRESDRPQ